MKNTIQKIYKMENLATIIEFINKANKSDIDKYLDKLDDYYYNNNDPILDDSTYDLIQSFYENRFGKRPKVRSIPTNDNKINLPIYLPSLNKVKNSDDISKYSKQLPGPYIVTDKIDGHTALYVIKDNQTFLYSGGDGYTGNNISHLLKYLNLPKIDNNCYIRGELVIYKTDFDKYKGDKKTKRGMLSSILYTQDLDEQLYKLLHFIPYNLYNDKNLTPLEQYTILKEKFEVPYMLELQILDENVLLNHLKDRKQNAPYDIDGLVITQNKYYDIIPGENPKEKVAYKVISELKVATVVNIEWSVSRHKYLKPIIKTEPIKLLDKTVKSFTGFNAAFIYNNNIGKGSKLLVTISGDTIPTVLDVIESTKPELPPDDGTWKWNETKVDIVLLEENDVVKIEKISEFFKQLNAKFVGRQTVEKLYQQGLTDINKILEADINQILGPGIADLSANRIITNINESLNKANLATLMSASSCFGVGFGEKKIQMVLDLYPDILEMEINDFLFELLINIKGYDEKTASRFIQGLINFKEFMNNTPKIKNRVLQLTDKKPKKLDLYGHNIVFTGFRNNDLKAEIESRGGKVSTSVSKNTTLVLISDKPKDTAKLNKAVELNIPIMYVSDFKSAIN